jgi:hypothetical protein
VKTITCKLSDELNAALTAVARKEGVSKSDIIRKAIEDRMELRQGKKSRRAFDLVGNLSGSLKGPPDLLTNSKFREDFGD